MTTREQRYQRRNTYYNTIDTLVFAFGKSNWSKLCRMFVPYVQQHEKFEDLWTVLQGKTFLIGDVSIPNPALYTILDCLHWAIRGQGRMTDSLAYQISMDVSITHQIEVLPCCS